MASLEKRSSKNRLLAALPPREYRRLLPKLETVSLSLKQRIYESLRTIDYVYFPLNGIVSIVAFTNDGNGIEAATVGNEGMVGCLYSSEQTRRRSWLSSKSREKA